MEGLYNLEYYCSVPETISNNDNLKYYCSIPETISYNYALYKSFNANYSKTCHIERFGLLYYTLE